MKTPSNGSRNAPRSPLFEGLSGAELESVLSNASRLRFHRNSIAINQRHPADRIYLLTQGRGRFFVVTHDGRRIVLRWITPGEVFGAAAISPTTSSYLAGVEMVEESSVLVWNRSTIRALAAKIPRLLENIVLISQGYLEWYISAHEMLTTQDAAGRLALLLIRLAESMGEHVPNGIRLDVRNEELANAANMTVFTVSRLLSNWQQHGAVSKTRNQVVILSADLLLRQIEGQTANGSRSGR